jgi:hypothetical protein
MESMSSYFSTGIAGAISLSTIAFVTVFCVLGGLTFIIVGVRYLAAAFERGSTPGGPGGKGSSRASSPSTSAPTAAAKPEVSSAQPSADRGKVIAAITGALLSAGSSGFRIKSITPAGTQGGRPAGSFWKQAALMEGLSSLDRQVWKQDRS